MKKILIIILTITLVFLMTGYTTNNLKYYKNISQTVIDLYRNSDYDKKDIQKEDINAIDNYLSTLTHKNQIVNVSNFITKTDDYYVKEENTSGIWVKNNTCYIKYEDLNITEDKADSDDPNYEIEKNVRVVCDNYYAIIYASDFYPNYLDVQLDPKYDYIYLDGSETKSGYEFIYRSSYDGTGIKVTITLNGKNISKIETSIKDVSEYKD